MTKATSGPASVQMTCGTSAASLCWHPETSLGIFASTAATMSSDVGFGLVGAVDCWASPPGAVDGVASPAAGDELPSSTAAAAGSAPLDGGPSEPARTSPATTEASTMQMAVA